MKSPRPPQTCIPSPRPVVLMIAVLLWLYVPAASAHLDLAAARLERLNNGLTLIVLEDHYLPVVSVQMLYRAGARNETTGGTGLAHFLEHMAFRSAKNFPDTQLASSIYAVGGEWHAYTWLDQTTYFETAPRQHLDLLLRIESDRMTRLDIPESDVTAERGAVLAEMHGYENDPNSVLQDNVLYQVFLAHPYRNNAIGWESDVAHISHADLVSFYRQYYQPGNAVLAVVGDVQADQVKQWVQQVFGTIPGKAATPPPHTVEPGQIGERRIYLRGPVQRKYFKIAYHAPAVNNPDFAAFLLAQELLAGGSGVNFLQNDWGTPVRADNPLSGITLDLNTWFPPSDQDYVFVIGGSAAADASEAGIEGAIESRIADVRKRLQADGNPMTTALEQAKQRVLRALVFDVETTEDAAHQLAFFSGLDALDVLTALPQAIGRVGAADIGRVLDRYLPEAKRTIGWYTPADAAAQLRHEPVAQEQTEPQPQSESAGLSTKSAQDHETGLKGKAVPVRHLSTTITHLGNGTPVIIERSPLSATVSLKVLTSNAVFPQGTTVNANQAEWGISSLDFALLPQELPAAIGRASTALKSAAPALPPAEPPANDPAALLQRYLEDILGLQTVKTKTPGAPLALFVSGDIDPAGVLPQLEHGFSGLKPAARSVPAAALDPQRMDIEVTLAQPAAQEQLGYVVRAPEPGEAKAAAWQMALYIFSHGYEGRLGKQAISRQGLIYYIDSAYRSDGRNGWITLRMGVDPDKLPAMKQLLQRELLILVQEPPSQQEVDEARQYLLGRYISAAQSNPELADDLALQWLWYGHIMSYNEFEKRLTAVGIQDLVKLLPAFVAGSTVAIRNPRSEQADSATTER